MKTLMGIAIGAAMAATVLQAAPVAGCYDVNPPGNWAELLLNGQDGAVGNEISAWDGATYEFSGATLVEVQADATGEWDWITKYTGGTLVLSNTPAARWANPCGSDSETSVAFTEVWVKTRSTRFATNDPGRLEFELSAESGSYKITGSYAGIPTLLPDGSNVVVTAELDAARICVGQSVRLNVCQSSLNLKSHGVMPVIIYGGANLDVTDIDTQSIKLECVPALRANVGDANCDGYRDLLLKFSTPAVAEGLMQVSDKTIEALLVTGALKDGTPISGSDNVRILNKAKPAKPHGNNGKAKGKK